MGHKLCKVTREHLMRLVLFSGPSGLLRHDKRRGIEGAEARSDTASRNIINEILTR
jgi:hypothetical protein